MRISYERDGSADERDHRQAPSDAPRANLRPAADPGPPSRLSQDTELIGQVEGSGLREPAYLVRRGDGQVVQL
jgi:hypothetical protein